MLERQQSASSGVSEGWHKLDDLLKIFTVLDSNEKATLFFFHLIYIFIALLTHSCTRAHTHTRSHIKRVRESDVLDQTDSFGLGMKESSYLKTPI